MKAVEHLLSLEPFAHARGAREKPFLDAMKESLEFHQQHSEAFQKLCAAQQFDAKGEFALADIPLLPVRLFKTMKLLSVPEGVITRNIRSSATTGKIPSQVFLDGITTKRQTKALAAIMSDFIGKGRKRFIIFDAPATMKASAGGDLSSRGGAIRGFLPFAKSMRCVLDENLELDTAALKAALEEIQEDDEVCIFGFTWLLYQVTSKNEGLASEKFCEAKVLHIGGWKKLTDLKVDKEKFNETIARFFGAQTENVRDFYGMTEQLGTIYIDCEAGNKHVPVYADLLIRDAETFAVVQHGTPGFIQLLSPLPHSYPGVSLLTDDIGVIIGEDDCPCGRKGKFFIFKERAKKSRD
jgi:phenylacetate-coenzyme A ligase PaaK-like adenylate-forming protein